MPTDSTALLRDLVLPMLEQDLVPIVQLGHPALRRAALPFNGELDAVELDALIALLRRVMHAAPGVGLAAPQVGIPLQIAVLEDTYDVGAESAAVRERSALPFFSIINPRYEADGEETAEFFEGCLSFEGYQGVVRRPRSVVLDYTDQQSRQRMERFTGWQARIVQHETDHLDGTVYVDRMLSRSLCSNDEYSRRWATPDIGEAQRMLGF
ncbi:peptide deformylase [Arthrobacter zhaoxinii]|uniref:Peptide deformylase n=1 Tax=Arthrobacter zhaoxinii TaxID=2964616 RepID=A0ABY5YLJ1_9MICC|nr:peptide deformylase [Arthrobacter zhaoxinii]UWX95793.1 peptide deformylase [Arthrobacter zhaoxinii]